MDGVITMDDARALVGDVKLWPRVRDFLWDFAPQVHESWLEPNQLSLRDSPRVKRYILDSLGVEPCFHAFPKEDGSRILLLDGATLESAAKWLGALACTEVLRRVTNGATVRELKAALPGIYPEVFGYTMYFGSLEALKFGSLDVKEFGSLDDGKFGGADVEKAGCEILLQSLSSLPVPLMHRLKLKFPKGMMEMELPDLKTSKLPNLQTSIFKLLKLKFPEVYKLCCS